MRTIVLKTAGAVGCALACSIGLGGCASTPTGGAGSSSADAAPALVPLAEPEPAPDESALRDRVAEDATARAEEPAAGQPSPAAAADPFAAPEWAEELPSIEGRTVTLGVAEARGVRAARVAAIEHGLGALMRTLGVETEPAGTVVERARVVPMRDGGYKAYVLITAPEQR